MKDHVHAQNLIPPDHPLEPHLDHFQNDRFLRSLYTFNLCWESALITICIFDISQGFEIISLSFSRSGVLLQGGDSIIQRGDCIPEGGDCIITHFILKEDVHWTNLLMFFNANWL